MYLHVGKDILVRDRDILGVFDIENTTVSKITKEFISGLKKQGTVVNVSEELPKSYVLCERDGQITVYISQISSATLNKRTGFLEKISNVAPQQL